MLGLTKEARMPELIDDHAAIATAVKQGHTEKAVELGLIHLSRLDETIKTIHENNPNYFEP
jgi:DNA-binding GntR family transcriptional regulator